MSEQEFPQTLYVHSPLDPKRDPFDGYATYEDAEEDDTVAVYILQRVCRVKHKKEVLLINEEEMKSYEK